MVLAAMHTHMHRRMQTKYAYIYRHMHTDISIAFDSRILVLGWVVLLWIWAYGVSGSGCVSGWFQVPDPTCIIPYFLNLFDAFCIFVR